MLIIDSLNNQKIVALLGKGAVGVLPTDTLYGLVCRASDDAAVKRLYALKKREAKPGTVIAASLDQLIELGIKARYLKAVRHFWPGSVSIVVPSHDLAYIHLGKGSIALRIPANESLIKLLQQTGPLLTTSVNYTGQPPANTLSQAQKYFDKLDFYVRAGDLSARKPSTIIRIVDDAVEILRQGGVTITESGEIQ